MTNSSSEPRRRRRHYTTKGILLFACLTSALASSTSTIRGEGKLQPPPPPPPKKVSLPKSTQQNNSGIRPPPPPSSRNIPDNVKEDSAHEGLSDNIPPPPTEHDQNQQSRDTKLTPPSWEVQEKTTWGKELTGNGMQDFSLKNPPPPPPPKRQQTPQHESPILVEARKEPPSQVSRTTEAMQTDMSEDEPPPEIFVLDETSKLEAEEDVENGTSGPSMESAEREGSSTNLESETIDMTDVGTRPTWRTEKQSTIALGDDTTDYIHLQEQEYRPNSQNIDAQQSDHVAYGTETGESDTDSDFDASFNDQVDSLNYLKGSEEKADNEESSQSTAPISPGRDSNEHILPQEWDVSGMGTNTPQRSQFPLPASQSEQPPGWTTYQSSQIRQDTRTEIHHPQYEPRRTWEGNSNIQPHRRPPPQTPGRSRYQQQIPLQNQPPQNQAPYRKQPQKHASSPTWKTLWNKVERSLDGLANLEESVAGRAQQLVSSVGSSLPNSGARDRPSPVRKAVSAFSGNSKKKPAPKAAAPAQFTPYGQKYQVAAQQKAQKEAQQVEESNPTQRSYRPVDWDDLMEVKKIISANGGAASPSNDQFPPTRPNMGPLSPDGHTRNPPPNRPGDSLNPTQQSFNTPPIADNNAPQARHPSPYEQMATQVPAKPVDTHSRASRIPWDSSVKPKQAPPATRPNQLPRYGDDDFEKVSLRKKILKFLPGIPRIPSPGKLFGRRDKYAYESMDAWKDDEEDDKKPGIFGRFRRKPATPTIQASSAPRPGSTQVDRLAPPLAGILERCDNGKSSSLLSDADRRQARSIGRSLATSDGITVMFLMLGLQQIPNLGSLTLPTSVQDIFSTTLPMLGTIFMESMGTWAPFLLISAYLTVISAAVLFLPKVSYLASAAANTSQHDAQYAQLYLRLATSLPIDGRLPGRIRDAAASQVETAVSIARLRTFVTLALSLLVIMTVSVVRPVFTTIADGLFQLVALEEWRSWPIAWKALGASCSGVIGSVYSSLEILISSGMTKFLENPLHFAFHLSIAGSLVLISLLPRLEEKRRVKPFTDDDDDLGISPVAGIEQLAKLGASSASRLSLLSENFSIENALERWRLTGINSIDGGVLASVGTLFRGLIYSTLSAILCIAPLIVAYFVGALSFDNIAPTGLRWESPVDVSVILLAAYCLVNGALQNAIISAESRPLVKNFLTSLSKTLGEIKESNKSKGGIQFMSSVSPTAGLLVRDLWASHTSKRAWAVRGANLMCKNGEVLAILGDDEAGKTRLLTAISEALIFPPKRSLTTNKVRGSVAVGGVDGSKWDQPLLKRRLGILLSDVRTIADTATLFSGWTMEELLEPIDGLRSIDPSHRLSTSERSSIILALKITGLYSTLLPKLPSKLSTIVTANEEDMHPSALRPGCIVLSPAVWSKVILAKVLAQTIFDNDNAASSTDRVESCLMGSVLILDDPTVLLSEVEEAKLLSELRSTGAATIFTSNKWATGRFADNIAVVKDGAVVETGTHNELLARGPQQSVYAAKWHAMTMQ